MPGIMANPNMFQTPPQAGAPSPMQGIWDMIIGNLPSKMAEAGVPPPPSVPSGGGMTQASPMGASPQNMATPPSANAAAIPTPMPAAGPTPGANVSQFDLMSKMMPGATGTVQQPVQPGAPMILPGAPGSPEDLASALTPKPSAQPSSAGQVQAPEAPKNVNPSTPSLPALRDINLDPMMQIIQQVMARQQPTQLPQLSNYLQRRPQS